MIRLATESDIPRLVEMGREFRAALYADQLADNPDQMARLGKQLIAQNGLLVSERDGQITGMIGFVVHNHFMSGERMAGEVMWWTDPEHRGDGIRLLHEAEKRAKMAGATKMQMIAPTAKVAQFYKRCGFEWLESSYQKAL